MNTEGKKKDWVKPSFTVTQAQFEKFFDLLEERKVKAEEMSAASYAGEVVKAAADAGWLSVTVAESDPRWVWLMHLAIKDYVNEVFEIPKN
jgi:hypothetical protein